MSAQTRRFVQVDVFPSSTKPLSGNPVAVVIDSEKLSTEQMQKFASWTNLSETTFLLPPTDPDIADYRLRIFTIAKELPFAGHPTLGSCRAWLQSGGISKREGKIIQECDIGLVTIKSDPSSGRLSFAAPGFVREGEVSSSDLQAMCNAMGIGTNEVLASRWIDNGPGWVGLLLKSAEIVLGVKTNRIPEAKNFAWGIIGAYPKAQERVKQGLAGDMSTLQKEEEDDGTPHFELRGFCPDIDIAEDPVTGSLNAGVAKWLISSGLAPQRYTASQGTCLGRNGRIYLSADNPLADGGEVWVSGDTQVCVEGTVLL